MRGPIDRLQADLRRGPILQFDAEHGSYAAFEVWVRRASGLITGLSDQRDSRTRRSSWLSHRRSEGYTTDLLSRPEPRQGDGASSDVRRLHLSAPDNKFKEVDGVLIPFSFSQHFEMPSAIFVQFR